MDHTRSLLLRLLSLIREFVSFHGPERQISDLHELNLDKIRTMTNQSLLFTLIRFHDNDDVKVAAVNQLRGQSRIESVAFDPDLRTIVRLAAIKLMTDDFRKALLAKTDRDIAVAVQAASELNDDHLRAILCEEPEVSPVVRMVAAQGITNVRILQRLLAFCPFREVLSVVTLKLAKGPILPS